MADPISTGVGFDETTVPLSPPSNPVEAFQSGELEQGIKPQGLWESLAARLKASGTNLPAGIPGISSMGDGEWIRAGDQFIQSKIEESVNSKKVEAKQLNEMFPGMVKPFDGPMYENVARMQYLDDQKFQHYRAWAARGDKPTGWDRPIAGLVGGATGAAAGIPGGPWGIGAGAVIGGGLGAAVGIEGAVANLDPVILATTIATGGAFRAAGVAPTLRTAFVENLAANAAVEVPSYLIRQNERQDVSIVDSALNVGGTAILGTALHFGIQKGIQSLLERRVSTARMEQEVRNVIANEETGTQQRPSQAAAEVDIKRAAGLPRTGAIDQRYNFTEIADPSDRPYFAAVPPDGGDPVALDEFGLGAAVHGSDNGFIANNIAGAPEAGKVGEVIEFKVTSDTKLIDIDAPMEAKMKAAVLEILEPHGIEQLSPEFLPEGLTMREVVDAIPPEMAGVKQEIKKFLQFLGYDGYRSVNDVAGQKSNRVAVWLDKASSKVEQIERTQGNPDVVPVQEEADELASAARMGSPEHSNYANPELEAQIKELEIAKPHPAEDVPEIVKELESNADLVIAEYAKTNPEILEDAEIKAIRRQSATDKQELDVMKRMMDCVTNGVDP